MRINGKVEGLSRTLEAWACMKLFVWFSDRKKIARWIERRAFVFKDWYNTVRPNQAVGFLTPEEAWSGVSLPETVAVRAHGPQTGFGITRTRYRGDPHLLVFDIAVEWPEAA